MINLTGELIAGKRWTQLQKEFILKSRVDATNAVVCPIASSTKKPSLLLNFSGAGFYGGLPAGDVPESFPNGDGFLAHVCKQWEAAALVEEKSGVRVVTPRLGVVVARDGGALKRLILSFTTPGDTWAAGKSGSRGSIVTTSSKRYFIFRHPMLEQALTSMLRK